MTGWWFLFLFLFFNPYLGKISNLTNIFQRGWNYQLDEFKFKSHDHILVIFPSINLQANSFDGHLFRQFWLIVKGQQKRAENNSLCRSQTSWVVSQIFGRDGQGGETSNIFDVHPCLGKWSNLTCAYFWNGLKLNHQLENEQLPVVPVQVQDCVVQCNGCRISI